MILATNIARFGRVHRTSQTLRCLHLCCVTGGYLQDLSSLAGLGDGILRDYARLGYAFLAADDPGSVRTLTDAGICCALFACSYPFSSCALWFKPRSVVISKYKLRAFEIWLELSQL